MVMMGMRYLLTCSSVVMSMFSLKRLYSMQAFSMRLLLLFQRMLLFDHRDARGVLQRVSVVVLVLRVVFEDGPLHLLLGLEVKRDDEVLEQDADVHVEAASRLHDVQVEAFEHNGHLSIEVGVEHVDEEVGVQAEVDVELPR